MTIEAFVQTGLRELRWRLHVLRATRRTLMTLLLVDLTFIALHILRTLAMKYGLAPFDVTLQSPLLAIDVDGGYSEDWQYAKEFAAAVLLLLSAWRARQAAVYVSWAALFAFAALDDSLELHERAGALLGPFLPHMTRNLHEDVGQLLFASAVGAVLLGIIVCTSFWSAPRHAVRAWLFIVPVAGLAACGIGVDLLHAVVGYSYPGSNLVLTVIEDGGEMLFISLGCALALATFMRAAEPVAQQAPVRPGLE